MKKNSIINKSSEVVYSTLDRQKEKSVNMLKKAYDNYNDDKYVLWLDFDLYSRYNIHLLDAKIEFLDADGNVIQVAADTYTNNKKTKVALIRKPYINKRIRQIGMKNGRMCVYGYPVLFDKYSDIECIKAVRTIWTAYKERFLGEISRQPFDMYIEELVIEYKTCFIKSKDNKNHWFTLCSKDTWEAELQEAAEKEKLNGSNTLLMERDNEYDYKVGYNGTIELEDSGSNETFKDSGCIEWWGRNEADNILYNEMERLEKIPFNEKRIKQALEEISPACKTEVNYYRYMYVGHTNVYAKECADIPTYSDFGF